MIIYYLIRVAERSLCSLTQLHSCSDPNQPDLWMVSAQAVATVREFSIYLLWKVRANDLIVEIKLQLRTS